MPSKAREQQLLDAMWERVAPLIPKPRAHPKGGRPFADDKACFAVACAIALAEKSLCLR